MKAVDELDQIIRQAQHRDPAAFDALVDRYSSRLYGFLYRFTGRVEDAEDLVQEVFVRVVRMIGQYAHDGRFEAWLFRIAANLARDRVRRLGRTPHHSTLDGPAEDEVDGSGGVTSPRIVDDRRPDGQMELAERCDRLQAALIELPPAEREVVMLRHFSDLSFADIAEIMGTPLGTALARSHRGLARLRALMEESE